MGIKKDIEKDLIFNYAGSMQLCHGISPTEGRGLFYSPSNQS